MADRRAEPDTTDVANFRDATAHAVLEFLMELQHPGAKALVPGVVVERRDVCVRDLLISASVQFAIDHVAWILNQETLDALAGSPLLQNEFSNSRGQKAWDGGGLGSFSLFGERTQYLEFRREVRQEGLEVSAGDGMVAFNAEKKGSVDWIIARMTEEHPESTPSKSLKTLMRGEPSARSRLLHGSAAANPRRADSAKLWLWPAQGTIWDSRPKLSRICVG